MPFLAPLLAAAVPWCSWSAETLDQARREDKAVFLVVAGRSRPAAFADDAVSAALSAHFVAVSVDRDERPDLADVARLSLTATSGADPREPAASLWVVFTPSLHPIAGGALEGHPVAALADRLASVASDYREHRAEVEARAGIAAARLASSQAPEPPRSLLDGRAIERALSGVRDGSEPTPGGIRLLLAESSRSPLGAKRASLARAMAALLAAPDEATVADEALRLRFLSEGFAVTAQVSLGEAAAAAALRLQRGPRHRGGLFVTAVGDARAFAFENGLAISALTASSSALGRPEDVAAAAQTATATLERLGPWSALARCASGDGRCGPAYLEDYAFLAEGLLDLHEATGEVRWRDEARHAVDAAIGRFLDTAAGGFFATEGAHGPLPVRLMSGYDDARPSANGVMASVLTRMGRATGEKRYADLARGVVDAFRGDLQVAPRGMETMAAAAMAFVTPVAEDPPGPARSARETRGPVTVEVTLGPTRVTAGGPFSAAVALTIAPPWTVNGHRPPARDLIPLTVSVPDDRLTVGLVRYPDCAACSGSALVVVPLRVRAGASAGPTAVRLTARYQRCRGARCEAPESVVLEAPLVLEAPAR